MGRAPSPAIRLTPKQPPQKPHNFSEAVAVADRIAILQKGELLAVRRAGGLSVEQLRDFYLEITGERDPFEWPEGVPA